MSQVVERKRMSFGQIGALEIDGLIGGKTYIAAARSAKAGGKVGGVGRRSAGNCWLSALLF